MRPTALSPPTMVERTHIPRNVKRLLGERSLLLGSVVLVTVGFMALAAPILAPHDPAAMKPSVRLSEPIFLSGGGTNYLLGTDFLGRDVLSRIIYGARVSLLVGLCTVLGAGIIGVVVGAVAGYYGKWTDEILMRLVDMGLAVPGLLLALIIVMLLGAGMFNVILVLSVTGWLGFARVTRGVTLSLKERDFILAARSYGAADSRIIIRHLIPNLVAPITVLGSQQLGVFIYAESSLSFLGLGVPLDTPTWGSMIAQGRSYLDTSWWISTLPGIVLTVTVLGAFYVGDGLRDVLDPRLRR
jgi:peptide/nickel transport system permease protein